ncbi:MAG: hypothetical protein AAB652_01295 [Patescibacteria group bacterium]
MKLFKFAFGPTVGALTIYLGTHQITPRWPTLIVGLAILAIGYRFIDRKAPPP